jgi:hypothetical protein
MISSGRSKWFKFVAVLVSVGA